MPVLFFLGGGKTEFAALVRFQICQAPFGMGGIKHYAGAQQHQPVSRGSLTRAADCFSVRFQDMRSSHWSPASLFWLNYDEAEGQTPPKTSDASVSEKPLICAEAPPDGAEKRAGGDGPGRAARSWRGRGEFETLRALWWAGGARAGPGRTERPSSPLSVSVRCASPSAAEADGGRRLMCAGGRRGTEGLGGARGFMM
ncbi:hypothetical protein SRHO_G00031900 [Serrasalmus rhombeus]